jgi:hypothetical protein
MGLEYDYFFLVELGLKLEDRLKQKGLDNIKNAHSFDKFVEKEKVSCQNSDNLMSKNRQIDTKKEIADFANTSHDTVMKLKPKNVKHVINFYQLKTSNS